jgi:hypothetical protein
VAELNSQIVPLFLVGIDSEPECLFDKHRTPVGILSQNRTKNKCSARGD